MAELFFRLEVERQRILEEGRRDLNRQRVVRDRSQAWELTDGQFLKRFRLTRDMALSLCEVLKEPLQGERSTSLPVDIKILTALRFYARGGYQLDVGENMYLAISQSSVCRCLGEVTTAIIGSLEEQYIKFPITELEKTVNALRFQDESDVPGIIGVIDCTHVAIVAPPAEHPEFPEHLFVNRKGYHSLNVQLICDYDLMILNVNAKFPGSSHDSYIFNNSMVSRHLENSYRDGTLGNFYIIGDSGYALTPYCIIPPLDPPPRTAEAHFTKAFCKARASIERCNGCLKQRFRCLLKDRKLHYMPNVAANIVRACCILHNMCRLRGIPDDFDDDNDNAILRDDDLVQQPDEAPVNGPLLQEGRRVRQQLIERFRR